MKPNRKPSKPKPAAATVWMTRDVVSAFSDRIGFHASTPKPDRGIYCSKNGQLVSVCTEEFQRLFGFLQEPGSCQRVTVTIHKGGKGAS